MYSGQSIEHVTPADADVALAEVLRVLRPGGFFCLDTPNADACRMQLAGTGLSVTNPDHKVEYTHAELSAKLRTAGFEIRESWGLSYLPGAFRTGVFSEKELGLSTGVFAAVEKSYLLAYLCARP